MNKADLITAVAEKTGFTKKDVEQAINATVSSIEEALVGGDKVQLIGFGRDTLLAAGAGSPSAVKGRTTDRRASCRERV